MEVKCIASDRRSESCEDDFDIFGDSPMRRNVPAQVEDYFFHYLTF